MTERPNYTTLTQALEKIDAEMQAAESHGALCGMICAAGKADLGEWLKQIIEEFDLDDLLIKEASQLLAGLYQSTQEQFNDPEVKFELLLPDDDSNLSIRTQALASWCQGFAYGLATGGLKKDIKLPADTAELIQDMVQIAQLDHDEVADDDTDEDAYMHIYEYVRMGVLLINEELQPVMNTSQTQH